MTTRINMKTIKGAPVTNISGIGKSFPVVIDEKPGKIAKRTITITTDVIIRLMTLIKAN